MGKKKTTAKPEPRFSLQKAQHVLCRDSFELAEWATYASASAAEFAKDLAKIEEAIAAEAALHPAGTGAKRLGITERQRDALSTIREQLETVAKIANGVAKLAAPIAKKLNPDEREGA